MKEVKRFSPGEKRMQIKKDAISSCNNSCWEKEFWISRIEFDGLGRPDWCLGTVQDVKCKGECSFRYNELNEIYPARRELI